jgi:hypothetical protein
MEKQTEPIDDIMCERILQHGKYINNTQTLTHGSKILNIMCDKCFAKEIPASFHLDTYDICLLCAHKHKSRDIIYDLDNKCEYPEYTAKTTKKFREIMNKFTKIKINEGDTKFARQLVYINFSMLRNILPKAFWDNLDQYQVDTYDDMLLRYVDEFYYTFGPDFLAKVYKAEYDDASSSLETHGINMFDPVLDDSSSGDHPGEDDVKLPGKTTLI